MSKLRSSGDKCPAGFPPEAWAKLIKIEQNTERVDKIEELVTSESAISENQDLRETVALLVAKQKRLEITVSRLKEDHSDLKQYQMKYNLIFGFDDNVAAHTDIVKEIDGEDTIGVIRRFMSEVMHVPDVQSIYIPVAHRLNGRTGKHRAILAKFPVAKQLELILKHGNRLKGTRHSVARQTPPDINERKQFAMDEFKAMKTDSRNRARINNGKLYLRGEVQTKYLPPSLPDPSSDPLGSDIGESSEVRDHGSTFRGYAVQTTSLKEVTAGINQILKMPSVEAASHIIFSYRVSDGKKILENFDSDDDHGMGLDLLKMLRDKNAENVLCVVTRSCEPGFVHLGKKRFEYLRQTGTEALNNITGG